MAALQNDYYNFVAGSTSVVTTAETVAATTRGISTGFAGQNIFVQGGFQITTGAGITSLVIKIERGSTAGGTAIYTSTGLAVSASSGYVFTVAATDTITGDVTGQQYVITVTQNGATGNGTIINAWTAVTVG